MDYNKYERINSLKDLLEKGAITEEEFEREKAKILSADEKPVVTNEPTTKKELFGLEENTFLMLMHLSQFAGWISIGLGFILPVVMWLTNKDTNEKVDKHGKMIINSSISYFIYGGVSMILAFLLIGIPLMIILGILVLVSIIIGSIKANQGELWRYPLVIEFLK